MALPSASLGAMPSLNVPTYIPTTVVQKQPKLWQQALIGILANAAGQAASQGVGNAMSRDYAGEFGGQEATGWDKLTKGPKVSEKDAISRRQQAHDAGKLRVDAELETLRQAPSSRDVREKYQPELAASDRRQADMQQIIAQSKLNRREVQDKALLQDSNNNAAMLLEQIRAQLRAGDPTNVAQGRAANASAESQELQNRILKGNKQLFPDQAGSMAPVDPTVEAYKKSRANAATPTGVNSQTEMDMIRAMMDAKMSPEDIAQTVDTERNRLLLESRVPPPKTPEQQAMEILRQAEAIRAARQSELMMRNQ